MRSKPGRYTTVLGFLTDPIMPTVCGGVGIVIRSRDSRMISSSVPSRLSIESNRTMTRPSSIRDAVASSCCRRSDRTCCSAIVPLVAKAEAAVRPAVPAAIPADCAVKRCRSAAMKRSSSACCLSFTDSRTSMMPFGNALGLNPPDRFNTELRRSPISMVKYPARRTSPSTSTRAGGLSWLAITT